MGGVLALLLFVGSPTLVPGPGLGAGGDIAPASYPDLGNLGTGSEVRPVVPAWRPPLSSVPLSPPSSSVVSSATPWNDVLVGLVVLYSILLVMPGGFLTTWLRMTILARPQRWDGVERRAQVDRRRVASDLDIFERRRNLGRHIGLGGRRLGDRQHLRIA